MSRGGGGRSSRSSSSSRRSSSKSSRSSKTSKRMTISRARAIQSHADKTGKNQDFKSRAMRAAEKNKE